MKSGGLGQLLHIAGTHCNSPSPSPYPSMLGAASEEMALGTRGCKALYSIWV